MNPRLTEIEMRDALARGFVASGLAGRGNFWRVSGAETQWVIHLDRNPYGHGFGLELGLNLSTTKKNPPLKDCEVVLYAEHLPLGVGIEPHRVLDLEERHGPTSAEDVQSLAQAVAEYVLAAMTLKALRERYRKGEFRSSFVTKEGRAILSQ